MNHFSKPSMKFTDNFIVEFTLLPVEYFQALNVVQNDPEFAVPGCHYEIARGEREVQVVDFIRDQFLPDEPIHNCIAHINPWTDIHRDLWMRMVYLFIDLWMQMLFLMDARGTLIYRFMDARIFIHKLLDICGIFI